MLPHCAILKVVQRTVVPAVVCLLTAVTCFAIVILGIVRPPMSQALIIVGVVDTIVAAYLLYRATSR